MGQALLMPVPVPAPQAVLPQGHHHAQWLLPFTHRQSPLVSPEPEKEALDGAVSWRRKQLSEDGAGHAQGRTAGKSQSWGSNGLFRAPGRTFPLMAASLLSPASGLSADLPVPSGGGMGDGGQYSRCSDS